MVYVEVTLCKSTTQVCAHAPVLLRHLPVRKGLCLEPKRGPGRAILYIVQCIYTGTYDPYTVDISKRKQREQWNKEKHKVDLFHSTFHSAREDRSKEMKVKCHVEVLEVGLL